jgi:hypothetical protein
VSKKAQGVVEIMGSQEDVHWGGGRAPTSADNLHLEVVYSPG